MRTIRVYTDIELYFAVFAAFAAAFHIGLAFSSSQIATKEDNSVVFFLLSMLSLSGYCISEGLVYSGFFRTHSFMVCSTAFIAVFNVSIYLWLYSVTQKERVTTRQLSLYLLAIPGITFSLFSYFLPVEVKREVYMQYLHGFNYSKLNIALASFPMQNIRFHIAGWTHVATIVFFFSLSVRSIYFNKLDKNNENEAKLEKAIMLGMGSLAVNGFLALAVPLVVKMDNISGYNTLFTLPLGGVFYMIARKKSLIIEQALDHRNMMAKYLPRELVNKVMKEDQLSLEGGSNEGVVLFCDIRRFTELSESVPPETIVALLNEYFSVMNSVIQRHGGIISKYIGDAIMVVFSDDDDFSTMYDRAYLCSLRMMEALGYLNDSYLERGEDPISIGIALHCGQMIHGSVGCSTRMEYTVIGDTVNTASRIADLNAELKKRFFALRVLLIN